MRHTLAILLLAVSSVMAQAQVRLSGIFSDGMVLQRGCRIPVWGFGPRGEMVSVRLNGREVRTTVGRDGTWKVYLPKQRAGGPYTLRVNDIEVHDVLVGDVFLCTGQSNMELPVRRCMDRVADRVAGYNNPRLRYVKIPHQYNYVQPNADIHTLGWQKATPQTIQEMGAVAFFAGRHVQEDKDVPIGLINSSVGGTGVECWMSRDTLLRHAEWVAPLQDRKYSQIDWVDSVRRAENRASWAWDLRIATHEAELEAQAWRGGGYSYRSWMPVDIFSRWASGEKGHIYGSYWFHNAFELNTAVDSTSTFTLRLGAMKDADSVFVNGYFVGTTSYEYPPRIYSVPGRYLRKGHNDVVIKLIAQGGYPNFTRGKLYQLEAGDTTVVLSEGWTMRRGAQLEARPTSTYFVNTPTGLYNAMIAPLQDFPIRGCVWYQGENNTGMTRRTYASMLTSMARCWRNQFHSDFPFVVVQLAGFMSRHAEPLQQSGWCNVRLAQGDVANTLPHSALATAIDLGESNDIHPQRKDELGRRVALQWERLCYGDDKSPAEGPRPVSARLHKNRIVILFDHRTGRLDARRPLSGIAVAGPEGRFVWAEARVTGKYRIEVALPQGITPTILRYAYDDYPELSIYNTEGLPAAGFQVDIRP